MRSVGAPPVLERPLCLGCGKPLKPWYREIWKSDGSPHRWRQTDDYDHRRAWDEPMKIWDGTWQGFGERPGDIPTHCSPTCAARHGSRLAAMLLTATEGVVLNEEGLRRAKHGRPMPPLEDDD